MKAANLAQLHTSAAASSTDTMMYRAEEHTDFRSVEYWPEAANVRGGGAPAYYGCSGFRAES